MTTTLITGANKGIGREAARRLTEAGHDVWVGARDPGRGQAAADELGARFVQLDVTDHESVRAAVATVRAAGGLDVLVNNAAIGGGRPEIGATTAEDVARVHETNLIGVVRVTQAFLPLLEASSAPRIVTVSSGLGSKTLVVDPDRAEFDIVGLAYQSAKAAVNMLTVQWAKAYPAMRINVVDPGWTVTDLSGNTGPQTVLEGTDALVRMATVGPDGPTGTFTDRHGVVPW